MFDLNRVTYWGRSISGNWVRVNLKQEYYIKNVMIYQHSATNYRPKTISFDFLNKIEFNATLNNTLGWNKITLPSNIISNYINLTVKSKYGGGTWIAISELIVIGCRRGIYLNEINYTTQNLVKKTDSK